MPHPVSPTTEKGREMLAQGLCPHLHIVISNALTIDKSSYKMADLWPYISKCCLLLEFGTQL